jgi:hypothetical protein
MQYKVSTERRYDTDNIMKEEVLIIGIWTKGDSFTNSKPHAKVWIVLFQSCRF